MYKMSYYVFYGSIKERIKQKMYLRLRNDEYFFIETDREIIKIKSINGILIMKKFKK